MIVLDENGVVVENPDLETGHLVDSVIDVDHTWVVDKPSTGHWETVAEYPNGGKDISWVIDEDEEGHWETKDKDGNVISNFDGFIPDDWPKEETHSSVWCFCKYVKYTEDELEEMKRLQTEAEKNELISSLKDELAKFDYVSSKIVDYQVLGIDLSEEESERYRSILEQREQWREQIRQLEAEISDASSESSPVDEQ